MTATEAIEEEPTKKGGNMGLIIGVVLALVAGGVGFFAASSGLLPFGAPAAPDPNAAKQVELEPIGETQFVELDPLVVTIRSSTKYRLLRFSGQLEVEPGYGEDIEKLKPRIVDVMNTYLNALDASHFEHPTAMIKLRAQLLRRVQIVTGEGRIKDLLIMEFVLQ